jgi:hypothetical protein
MIVPTRESRSRIFIGEFPSLPSGIFASQRLVNFYAADEGIVNDRRERDHELAGRISDDNTESPGANYFAFTGASVFHAGEGDTPVFPSLPPLQPT